MANAPLPKMAGGYPSFGSQNANELIVTPSGLYVWNGSVWVPAMADVNGNQNVVISGSDILQPVDLQSHLQTMIQTHNAVSVALSGGWSQGSWFDTNGFDRLAWNFKNDASTNSDFYVDWSTDGTNAGQCGSDAVSLAGTANMKSGIVDTKARYARVALRNNDTVAHTMSAWAFLKA